MVLRFIQKKERLRDWRKKVAPIEKEKSRRFSLTSKAAEEVSYCVVFSLELIEDCGVLATNVVRGRRCCQIGKKLQLEVRREP